MDEWPHAEQEARRRGRGRGEEEEEEEEEEGTSAFVVAADLRV
jgi:hypothetical protein